MKAEKIQKNSVFMSSPVKRNWGVVVYKESKQTEKEDDVMDSTTVRKIDKTNFSGLTLDKKKLLQSLQGIATSPIDFNKIRDEEKYGKN